MSAMALKEWKRILELQLEPVLSAADSGAGLITPPASKSPPLPIHPWGVGIEGYSVARSSAKYNYLQQLQSFLL